MPNSLQLPLISRFSNTVIVLDGRPELHYVADYKIERSLDQRFQGTLQKLDSATLSLCITALIARV